ncbi:peptidoglycan recognition protein family protein [Clostridium kluyveri]|uniref:N-acetylmuramoyl-L-alanine amidase n=1 Tax=Clostridium kluyveri TaxID=1534 RepID=A0A1L5FC00_CLOKL|nr:N-acetylmuramoyl-L-alanine amidase [Clostridium kluyveri]APM40532.1 amidase [Clostridium kluyveri]
MLPITRKISPYNHSAGNDIKFIVMHDTGNYKDTALANATYFNGGDRQASAHYFVDDTSIYQVVEENQAAWHCGDGHDKYGIGNHNSIGIEMCNSGGYISDTTINNTLELVRSLMSKYSVSINNVVRHYDASRKDCPHNMSANNWAKWNDFKARLASGTNEPVKPNTLIEQIKALQYNLNIDYNAGLAVDGIAGPATMAALKGIQDIIVKGHKSNVVLWLQQKLEQYGYLKENSYTQMLYDEPTFQAVTELQKNWERSTDGVLRPETWSIFLNN